MAAMVVMVVNMDMAAVKEEKGRRRGMRTQGTRCGAVGACAAGWLRRSWNPSGEGRGEGYSRDRKKKEKKRERTTTTTR